MKFSFWGISAMKLKCPKCHSFVFERFRAIEAILVIAELFAFYKLVSSSLVTTYMIPVLLIGLVAFEYAVRFAYIMIQNKHNRNKY